MPERTLAERAVEAMGWHIEEDPNHPYVRYKLHDGRRWRNSGFNPQRDANDAIEFAEWAEANEKIKWERLSDSRVRACKVGTVNICERVGPFPKALTEAILAALEVKE